MSKVSNHQFLNDVTSYQVYTNSDPLDFHVLQVDIVHIVDIFSTKVMGECAGFDRFSRESHLRQLKNT
jgi:hypothetical protein